MYCLGLDIGRSGVKMVLATTDGDWRSELPIVPSVAKEIGSVRFGIDDTREWTTRYGDHIWAIGEDAKTHGLPQETNIRQWHMQDDYWALTKAIFERLQREQNVTPGAICAGLPSEASAKDREDVKRRIEQLVPGAKVKVVPQPVGAFMAALEADRLVGETDARALIIDIGRYSTDMLMTVGGRPSGESLHSAGGIAVAVTNLANVIRGDIGELPYDSLEKILRTGTFRNFRGEHDYSELVAEVIADYRATVIERLIERAVGEYKNAVDVLIMAGGGADLIRLEDRYPMALRPNGGRYVIAHGFAISARMIAGKGC
jgi:hypothetical protein